MYNKKTNNKKKDQRKLARRHTDPFADIFAMRNQML